MLLAIFCCQIALSLANPFHKYPYVFLLDVGNEELEKTNTEQLRVSIPGGSLAMKYPVMGEGDTISHVRVSGIDFGTDLKVNIVDGGPGYKYVVLVFMGNPGVSYDAVVTLQTLQPGTEKDTVNTNQIVGPKVTENSSYEVTDVDGDDNDDNIVRSTIMKQYSEKSNNEVMQASSKKYNYANDELTDNDNEESENTSVEEQDDDDSSKEDEEDGDSSNDEEDEGLSGEENEEDSSEQKTYFKERDNVSPRAEKFTYNNGDANSYDKPADIVDDSLYEKYQDLKPHFADGYKVYPQSSIYNKQYLNSYNKDEVEIEQMFNDEEIHNDARYEDDSNSIDSDYSAAEY